MFVTMDMRNFAYWVQSEREKRGWSQSDLSRQSGLHRAVINKIESGTHPMPETLTALAHAFGLSPITVFRQAGLLPPGTDTEIRLDDWAYLLNQLPQDDQEELRALAQIKIQKRHAQEAATRAQNFKPAKSKGT
jgi:transcriptional regulator with XRE-family HTH domain